MEFQDKIDNLSINYIVEEGIITKGGYVWHYRKWNNGIAECWHSKTVTPVTPVQSTQGNLYQERYDFGDKYQFPFTFTSIQFCFVTSAGADSHGLVQNANWDMSKINTIYVYRGNSGSYNMYIQAYVIGTWK